MAQDPHERVPLAVVVREWGRIGITGFGGPPAHIALLRELVVERNGWMDPREFQDANAACGLLPGPASTQLSMLCAYRIAGPAGVIVGGLAFITPAVILVIALSLLFLSSHPPTWVRAAGAGAGAVVGAVALYTVRSLIRPSFDRVRDDRAMAVRWMLYVVIGTASAVLLGSFLVVALLGCGAFEWIWRRRPRPRLNSVAIFLPATVSVGGLGAIAWTALKVGALSFGGGFVIVPLMQHDAVHTYHWMSNTQFLSAVALGQITPGPVVATVSAVGYAAHGVSGALLRRRRLCALVPVHPLWCEAFPTAADERDGSDVSQRRRACRDRRDRRCSHPACHGAARGMAVRCPRGGRGRTVRHQAGIVETFIAAALIGVVVELLGGPLPAMH